MTYHSHKLDSTHSHIIGRTDPITGDTIKENDKVVFCLACQSCFLEESWNYMNNRHCEQTDTLFFAPYIPSKLVAKRKKDQNSEPLLNKNTISILLILLFYGIYSSSIYLLVEDLLLFTRDRILYSVIIGFFPAVLSVMGLTSEKFTNLIGITKSKKTDIHILEEGLQIDDILFAWSNIEKIEYRRAAKEENNLVSPQIKIFLQNGNTIQEKFETKNPEHQKSFLLALAWASEQTKVEFYTKSQQEYALLVSVEKNYKNMKLGNRNRE
ncbi:hypothetical protein V9L05_19110 [Bernardetia sp. Wsw4-3y2]|uniref:hypothetical protein n=1 Tax=Bernardetia sp. Wsw4-3y2 TaxID=3127471 RepID=UPI0030D4C3D2